MESDKLQADIRDLIMEMIKTKEKMINSGNEDYLGLLLNTHHDIDESYMLSVEDIIDDCKTFYSAGHGTISLLLSWITLLLGIHTEWQEKARKEVQEVFGNENPSIEGIPRLKTVRKLIHLTISFFTLFLYLC